MSITISCPDEGCRNHVFNKFTDHICEKCRHIESLQRTGKPAPPAPAPPPREEGWLSTSTETYGTKAVTDVYRTRVEPNHCSKGTLTRVRVEILRRRWIFKDYWEFVGSFQNESDAIAFVQRLQEPMKYFEVKRPA
jgi:hypothetical protein